MVRELIGSHRLRVTAITAFELVGQDIGLADCLQAGICLKLDLPLATRNRKHFDRVEGLRLFDIID